jgi:protocatechuate 3,4-dioxygenase beta subunit
MNKPATWTLGAALLLAAAPALAGGGERCRELAAAKAAARAKAAAAAKAATAGRQASPRQVSSPTASSQRPWMPAASAPAHVTIARAGKGQRPLLVTGQVLRADGRTPAPGVVVYVYHTGSDGLYADRPGAPPRHRAWLRTDAQGRYSYRTLRPAPYPNGREAAHVHVQLWGPGVPAQWGTTLLFADDRLVPARAREESAALGRFAFVCAPTTAGDGVTRCRHDLRLAERGDRFEPVTRHGLAGPRVGR